MTLLLRRRSLKHDSAKSGGRVSNTAMGTIGSPAAHYARRGGGGEGNYRGEGRNRGRVTNELLQGGRVWTICVFEMLCAIQPCFDNIRSCVSCVLTKCNTLDNNQETKIEMIQNHELLRLAVC